LVASNVSHETNWLRMKNVASLPPEARVQLVSTGTSY